MVARRTLGSDYPRRLAACDTAGWQPALQFARSFFLPLPLPRILAPNLAARAPRPCEPKHTGETPVPLRIFTLRRSLIHRRFAPTGSRWAIRAVRMGRR